MDYREPEDEVASALADPVPVRLEHPGLVRQHLAQGAEQGLELVPVHGVADEHQPLAAQPRQEVRRVEPKDLARELVEEMNAEFAGWWVGTWGGCSGAAPSATACTRRPAGRSPRRSRPRPRRGTSPARTAAAPPRPAPTPRRTRRTVRFRFHPRCRCTLGSLAVVERETTAAVAAVEKVESASSAAAVEKKQE